MSKRKWLWIPIGLIGLCVCAIVVLSLYVIGGVPLLAGFAAPDFELTSLDGNTITLSQFRGNPVLLDMGATWCPDCQLAAPELQKLHETYPELVVLSVDSNEDAGTVQSYADANGLTYPIALDSDGEIARQYRIVAIPTLFFIDREGVIQDIIVETYSEEHVEQALAKIGITP